MNKNQEKVDIIIDALMSAHKMEYINLFVDILNYIDTGLMGEHLTKVVMNSERKEGVRCWK